jgi:hypothetical protein
MTMYPLSRAPRIALATLVLTALGPVELPAQTPASRTPASRTPASLVADSMSQFSQAGKWEQAATLARRGLGMTSDPDDQCTFHLGASQALAGMGLYGLAESELKVVDDDCAHSAGIRERSADVAALRRDLSFPVMPKTGMDFSAVDQFWKVADVLAADRTPTDQQWRNLLGSVGYRLATMTVPTVRSDMEIALRPSLRPRYDSLITRQNDQAGRLQHIAAAYTHRADIAHLRDSLTRSLPVRDAIAGAARFLPPHVTEGMDPPVVAFAIFRDDAYSLGPQGVIVDLYHLIENPLTPLLAHEFHHSYLSALSTVRRPVGDTPDAALIGALFGLRNEGIADLVDKPYPLSFPGNVAMSAYAKRYNEAYARTPAVLHSIDSLLVIAADDSTMLRAVGQRVAALLPSNGHYNGSYVAREVYETFGVDSLYPGVASPFALLRTYAAAERKRGNPPPVSPKAIGLLDNLERRYQRP